MYHTTRHHQWDLPPLQRQIAYARSSVEFTDRFDISGFLSDWDSEEQTRPQTFNENDGEEAVKCLRRCFQVYQPGNHVARKTDVSGISNFIHCKHASQLGKQYLNLCRILEEKARLEMLCDCLFRIKSATTFVSVLQQLVEEENKVWHQINHDSVNEVPVSKIFCLNALCEDLRTNIGHWNCIKQKLHTNRWLQPMLGSMYFQLDQVRRTLNVLQDKAIWWFEKFVLVGLQVFAHGNVDILTGEMISNVTRGLEDMNNIVSGLQKSNISTSKRSLSSPCSIGQSCISTEETNTISNFGKHLKAIPFARVLSILANERSKYAALETHRFFTSNKEFVQQLYAGKLLNYLWTVELSSCVTEKLDRDTSDYHTATGSMASLSAAVLKIGNVMAPDSPLVELAHRELMFAEMFLLIACNSTNFLRRNDTYRCRQARKQGHMVNNSKPPRAETPVLSRNDSLRKSVSWCDSANSSIKSQQISRYMDLYWNHFGINLFTMFYEPCWVRQQSLYYSDIGNMIILNTTVIALVTHTIQNVCLKDLFPALSVMPMVNAAKKCLHVAAFGAWDACMCQALTSHRMDKCYPCPLVNGDHSTRTGMLLRDMYQPLLNLLTEQLAESLDTSVGGVSNTLNMMVAVVVRLVLTSNLALQWCQSKTQQYLASMSVGNFLLVSQSDLKIIIDETRTSLYQMQMICNTLSQKLGPNLVENLSTLTNQLNVLMDSLQGLSGLCMKQFTNNCFNGALEYFKNNMPVGKAWKGKADEMPNEHNIYIENALEKILEPVLDGTGKLKHTAQLSVMSVVIEAMCQAWMTFILQEKIKFSFSGACQYALDVRYMHTWLQQNIVIEMVQQSVLDLPVLKMLIGTALLLMKQPSKRSSSKFREYGSKLNNDNTIDHLFGEHLVCDSDNLISHVKNPNDWLALRVHGGCKNWKGITACLNPDPQ